MSKRKGRFINKIDAQAEIQKFWDIQTATSALIKPVLSSQSRGVQTYYENDVSSFIFEKSLIEALFALTRDNGCNALRIYHAATAADDGNIKEGTSTVILIPAKLTYAPDGDVINVENVPYSDELTGIQYPGILANPPGGGTGSTVLSIDKDFGKPLSVFDLPATK